MQTAASHVKYGQYANNIIPFPNWSANSDCFFKRFSFSFQNALALTKGYDPSLLTRKSAISMRNHAMEKIIGHAKSMDCAKAQCEAPQCSGPKNDQSVSCDICSRWCHFICANVTGRSRDGFLCPICKAQYK